MQSDCRRRLCRVTLGNILYDAFRLKLTKPVLIRTLFQLFLTDQLFWIAFTFNSFFFNHSGHASEIRIETKLLPKISAFSSLQLESWTAMFRKLFCSRKEADNYNSILGKLWLWFSVLRNNFLWKTYQTSNYASVSLFVRNNPPFWSKENNSWLA